ncbi:hypothetical protein H310_13885 [Aphanomyces invadans]|uniref:Uncharacterized protein n=1 Tax=Aphanomyces invadans TaxID=157072 RepID=A0A024TC59_9STRA|nr:hypothetical protein H310_13885 [Aphanomyces invadans]ETV91638.1 hypothetical protein H310_13885 [Aphanomyces invadans]|eukprot:XP_008879757.1 hypothetical protein H310_13885 [Aphanomyces invadans]
MHNRTQGGGFARLGPTHALRTLLPRVAISSPTARLLHSFPREWTRRSYFKCPRTPRSWRPCFIDHDCAALLVVRWPGMHRIETSSMRVRANTCGRCSCRRRVHVVGPPAIPFVERSCGK